MMVLAVAVLVTFAGGLWFISHHKKEEIEVIPNHKANGNGLPPKPEERWKYIKELENRQITVPSPTEPSAGGVQSQTQLTDEQRQLLEQMQADMRQQPTQLNEVPWNEQTPAQRQQTLQRQQVQQQQQQVQQQQQQLQRQQQVQQQQQLQRQQQLQQQQRQQQLQQQQAARQQQQQAAPITREPTQQTKPQETAKAKAEEKASSQRWMVQCGSFKGTDQAESVRAGLAFEGFESRITTGGGWNRVVIGPFKDRSSVDSTVKRLHSSGHGSCIPLALP